MTDIKKIIIKILILLSIITIFGGYQTSYAKETNDEKNKNVVDVTEKIPGANCKKQDNGLYKCTTDRGFGAIMKIMGQMLKYFTYIAGLFAVLSLVVGGVMYSMGGANEGMKTKSKEYIEKSLIGLVLLLLSGTILYMIAPWIYV